jgi:large subunit ribosomal protein L18
VSIERKNIRRKQRRALRTKHNLVNPQRLPRVSVFRSLKHIYAQVIDDGTHKTLASCSSLEIKDLTGDKKSVAHAIGQALADKIKKIGIDAIMFDRGSFLYHGRVRSLADGLREGGIRV